VASKIDAAYFRLRASQVEYARRESSMLRRLRNRIDERCYVSWSAGKDSMVVAHAAHWLCGVPILMVDPGVPIHWTDEDKARMIGYAQAQGWNWRLFPWDKFRTATSNNGADYRKQIHADMFVDLTAYATAQELDRRITGMRASESKTRHVFLTASRGETKNTLQPLWNWSTEDVWTYTVKHSLPWLSIYDHLGPEARNGLIGKNGREHGRMAYLKRYYPQAFQRACELFEARDYV
jgi:3'-phosphoadenosine 5'-phosphosulfate sulfotransferase (PAPS reductase)/FAD synthetase